MFKSFKFTLTSIPPFPSALPPLHSSPPIEFGIFWKPTTGHLEPALRGHQLAVLHLCWSRPQQAAAEHAGREAPWCVRHLVFKLQSGLDEELRKNEFEAVGMDFFILRDSSEYTGR